MVKKLFLFLLISSILIVCEIPIFADGLDDLTQLRQLIGEYGISSFHLDDFSYTTIDFDILLRAIAYSRIDFSKLNYDAFLEVITTPETLSEMDIENIDEGALLNWLKDPATRETVNEMILTAKMGGSVSEWIRALYDDPEFLESFSLITRGKNFTNIAENLTSDIFSDILIKTSSALMTPKKGPSSETAEALSVLVQYASDILGRK